MISINQSNLHFIQDYFQSTKQQLENLQNELRFIAEDESPQFNLKVLTNVLSSCEESVIISLQLFKICKQLHQDKLFLENQINKINQDKEMLIRENQELTDSVDALQLNRRQNSTLFNQLQQEISLRLHQTQNEAEQAGFLEECNRKDTIYKMQLQHYENQLKFRDQMNKKMQLQLSRIKAQLNLKIIQLQLADLVLQDLWKQKNDLNFKQSNVGITYSPSLNQSYEKSVCTKSYQMTKKCSLMQDLFQSQITLPLVAFSSHLNKSTETLPEILQQSPKIKQDFRNLCFESKISISSACNQNEAINFTCSKKIENPAISYGIQTQDTSLSKRIHDWFRMKIVTQRIKI